MNLVKFVAPPLDATLVEARKSSTDSRPLHAGRRYHGIPWRQPFPHQIPLVAHPTTTFHHHSVTIQYHHYHHYGTWRSRNSSFSPPVRYDPFTGFLYVYTRILSGGPASPVIFINASRPFEMVSRLIRAALMRYSVCLLLVKAARIKYKTELTERRHRARRSGASW